MIDDCVCGTSSETTATPEGTLYRCKSDECPLHKHWYKKEEWRLITEAHNERIKAIEDKLTEITDTMTDAMSYLMDVTDHIENDEPEAASKHIGYAFNCLKEARNTAERLKLEV